MGKKWSQKTEKSSLVNNDEFLILDSEDANNATKNKRVKVYTLLNNGANSFSLQTVGNTTQQYAFLFSTAISGVVHIAAANAGNTKGHSEEVRFNVSLTQNSVAQVQATDFISASVSVAAVANSVTITLHGEAGETINWKGIFQVTAN